MIGATRPSTGFSITSRPTTSTEPTRSPDISHNKGVNGALQSLSNNPILRSLLGESGFEGVKGKGKGKAERAEKTEGKSAEKLDKLIEVIQQLVSALQSILGKQQPGQPTGGEQSGGTPPAGGAAPAGGTPPAGDSQSTSPTGEAQGTEGTQQAAPAEQENPLEKILQVLQQILQTLQQLKGGAQPSTQPEPPPPALPETVEI